MAVTKTTGFKAPYRSQTFQNTAHGIVQRNGLLSIDGKVETVSSTVTVPPLSFIQHGLIVINSSPKSLTIPPQLVGSYIVTVTASTPQDVDDLVYSFAQAPHDVAPTEVVVAFWDGVEWRTDDIVSMGEVISSIEQANIDEKKIGIYEGLRANASGSFVTVDTGYLIDPQGDDIRINTVRALALVDADPDYTRVDRVVYRRSPDSKTRIGTIQYITGNTFGGSLTQGTHSFFNNLLTNQVKVLVDPSDNSAHLLAMTGFGNTFSLHYKKIASDRTTQLVANTAIITTPTEQYFDAVLDSSGNIWIVYVQSERIKLQKVTSVGVLTGGVADITVIGNPATNPKVTIDYQDKLYIVFQGLMGPLNYQIFFTTRSNTAGLILSPVRLQNNLNNFINPSLAVTSDLLVGVAFENSVTSQVFYIEIDDNAQVVTSSLLVSGHTSAVGHGVLVDGAKKAQVSFADKKPYVFFLQDTGSGNYGLARYTPDDGTNLVDLTHSGEDIVDYQIVIDPLINQLHIITSQSDRVDYTQLDQGFVTFSIPLDNVTGGSVVSLAKDILGSLLQLWATPNPGTFSNVGSSHVVGYIGPEVVHGSVSDVTVANNQFLVSSDMTLAVGDQLVFSGSSHSNNGDKFVTSIQTVSLNGTDDFLLVRVNSNFSNPENPSVGTSVQAQSPDPNATQYAKSLSTSTSKAYRTDVLPTDVLIARIAQPGNYTLNYIPFSGPGVNSDLFGVYGAVDIDWGATSPGAATFSGGLKIIDLIRNLVYEVADGTYAMSESDVIYIYLDGVNFNPTPIIRPFDLVPWGDPIQALAFIADGVFQPHLLSVAAFTALSDGESDTIGEDLPKPIRERLGLISDTAFVQYITPHNILSSDDYATAISKLDNLVYAILTNAPGEETVIVNSIGGITTYSASTLVWDPSNTSFDIVVEVNGQKQQQDSSGGLGADFRKTGPNSLQFSYPVTQNSKINIRIERTGTAESGSHGISIKEDGSTITDTAVVIDFVGAGVSANLVSPGRVQVVIPGGDVNGTLEVQDEGGPVGSAAVMNFIGDGVDATEVSPGVIQISIPKTGNPLVVYDAGLLIDSDVLSINFVGAGITITQISPGVIEIDITGGGTSGGGSLQVKDEGLTIEGAAGSMNFVGQGVTATQSAPGQVQVQVPGLAVKDEGSFVSQAVTELNFVGEAVTITQTSAGKLRVDIPATINIQKKVRNMTGSTIVSGTPVAWDDDGSVSLADASDMDLSDFAGITAEDIADGAFGHAIKIGVAPSVLSTLGATPGQTVYLGTTPGTYTLTPPSTAGQSIIKLGYAEPPSGVQTPMATDLFLDPELIAEL